jgi:hypothetical protein
MNVSGTQNSQIKAQIGRKSIILAKFTHRKERGAEKARG